MRSPSPIAFWVMVSVGWVLTSCQEGADAASASDAETAGAVTQDPVTPPVEEVPSTFARFVEVGEDEGRFDVAVTTYVGPQGEEVSLVSSVHIADKRHYDELQQLFETYDVLLYELVADASVRPTPGQQRRGGGGPLGMMQTMLKSGLGLEFQLSAIDYTPDNFVHADLTPEGFAEAMEERGETFTTMFLRMYSQGMKQQRKLAEEREDARERGEDVGGEDHDLVSAFRRGEGRHLMRMTFARQLEQMDMLAAGDGEQGTVLLEGRNDRAVEVLREQIALGHKKLGIYYGAAHMSGIERSLLEDLGMRKIGHEWLVAWDISKRPDSEHPR